MLLGMISPVGVGSDALFLDAKISDVIFCFVNLSSLIANFCKDLIYVILLWLYAKDVMWIFNLQFQFSFAYVL